MKSHEEELSNERSNAEIYRNFLDRGDSIDYSVISRPASSNFTHSATPKRVDSIGGSLIGRVQLAQSSKGYEYSNLYIGPKRARAYDLKFRHDEEHAFEVFSWAAPISDLFYLGHYRSEANDLDLSAGVLRTLIGGHSVLDFADDVLSEPIVPIFPSPRLTLRKPPEIPLPTVPLSSDKELGLTQSPDAYGQDTPLLAEATEKVHDTSHLPLVRARHLVEREMKKPRKEQLSSLLHTLQSRQYELITQPSSDDLVIQGSPGTGKTVVAAHRVAYLINPESGNKGLEKGKVMLVGPTRAYSDHVRGVLIELGADPDRYLILSIEEFLTGIFANTNVKNFLPNQKPSMLQSFTRDLYGVADRAVFQFEDDYDEKYRLSLTQQTKKNPAKPKFDELTLGRRLELCYEFFRSGNNSARIVEAEIRANLVIEDETQEEIDEKVRRHLDTWKQWLSSLKPYADALADAEYQWFLAALAWHLDDSIDRNMANIEHVIVDEAQDLYPVEWEFLKALNLASRWTLVGDFNQQSTSHRHSSWKALCLQLHVKVEVQKLELGFRSTKAIMSLANAVLGNTQETISSLQFSEELPRSIKVQRKNLWVFAEDQANALSRTYEGGLISVIVPPSLYEESTAAFTGRGWRRTGSTNRWVHPAQPWTQHIPLTLATPVDLRGLEYDAVVLVEPDEYGNAGSRELYMGITRANRELRILHSTGLPPAIFTWSISK